MSPRREVGFTSPWEGDILVSACSAQSYLEPGVSQSVGSTKEDLWVQVRGSVIYIQPVQRAQGAGPLVRKHFLFAQNSFPDLERLIWGPLLPFQVETRLCCSA